MTASARLDGKLAVMGFAPGEQFEHAAGTGYELRRVRVLPTEHRSGARMTLVGDAEGNVWELLAEQ